MRRELCYAPDDLQDYSFGLTLVAQTFLSVQTGKNACPTKTKFKLGVQNFSFAVKLKFDTPDDAQKLLHQIQYIGA